MLDRRDRTGRFGGQLTERAVVVEPQHGGEVLFREARGRFHRDVGVGVGWVANHQDPHVARGDLVERAALHRENRSVGFEKVLALHALATRPRPNEQCVVSVAESDGGFIRDDDTRQERKRAVFKLHHDAFHRGQRGGDVEELKDDGLILAQKITVGDPKKQGITDLTGCARDCDSFWRFAHACALGGEGVGL